MESVSINPLGHPNLNQEINSRLTIEPAPTIPPPIAVTGMGEAAREVLNGYQRTRQKIIGDSPLLRLPAGSTVRARLLDEVQLLSRLHPEFAKKLEQGAALTSAGALCAIGLPLSPDRELEEITTGADLFIARDKIVVLIEHAPAVLKIVASEIAARVRQARAAHEQAVRDREAAEQLAAERAEADRLRQLADKPFNELPRQVNVVLHVASALPPGELRAAFVKLAGLLRERGSLGKPDGADEEIVRLAREWAENEGFHAGLGDR